MKVSAAVSELEARYEAMRERAERAEGLVRVYEAREGGQELARTAVEIHGEWQVWWKNGDDDPVEFSFSPGMWLLGLSETFLKHPMPFELRVTRKSEPASSNQGEGQ